MKEATSSQRRLDVIQAAVLYAQYCFANAQVLEGRYHANAAVTLAISNGLHRVGDANSPGSRHGSFSALTTAQALDAPRDSIEYGERVRLCWSVLMLDCSWNVALGHPPSFVGNASMSAQINLPWPLDLSRYDRVSTYTISHSQGQNIKRPSYSLHLRRLCKRSRKETTCEGS